MLKFFGASAARDFPAWSYRELRDCMVSVKDLTNNFNLAIFIDGLDEFEEEHGQLIDFIKYLHCQPGMKVCVSSRPWNAFRDAFSGCPRLRMELLTKEDMEAFVQGKFETSVAIAELRRDQPTIADGLVADIVRKSEGVFLWVSLVTDSVLGGIADGDTLADSYRLLNELPSDLSDLYNSLWSRVRPEHKAERARILRVLNEYSHSESKKYADLKEFSNFFARGLPQTLLWFSLSDPQASFSARHFARRLHSRTKGFIEIKPSGNVDYLHRTAHDWIMARWNKIQLEASADFDAHMALLTGLASTAHLANYASAICFCGNSFAWVQLALHHASMVSEKHRDRSFAELDRLADEIRDMAFKQASVSIAAMAQFRNDCWIFCSRQGFKNFGFVSFVAAFSEDAYSYVRAKMIAEPACYAIDGNAKDLIWSIVFGFNHAGFLLCYMGEGKKVFSELACSKRLDLAQLWFRYALERTKDRGALLSKLASLHDELSRLYREKRESCSGHYGTDMLRIFRSHGVGSSFEGRLRRVRYVVRDLFHRKEDS